ncbi:MAG: hypothetical protein ACM32E_23850 [Gemmatimonadota bacterium]
MPRPVQDPVGRRDEARWRTRRLSWLAAGGAATASVALGVSFAQLLPGHSAAASPAGGSQPGAGAPAPASGSGQPAGGQARPSRRPAQHQPAPAQPSQAPAPAPTPPQVVSGGS